MLTKIKATNFLSWGELDFDIPDGVTLIDGWNHDDQTSEGSGKSAISNALAWCVYGKLPKDANIDDVIKQGTKSCLVEAHFDNDIKIVRSRKPNDLYLEVEGEALRGKDVRETQQMIIDRVGVSFETFCQTIYFAQNYADKFISANQEGKAKIISEVQDLSIFDKATAEVKKLIKVDNQKVADYTQTIELSKRDLDVIAAQTETANAKIEQAKIAHQTKIDSEKAALENVENQLQEANNTLLDLESTYNGFIIPDVTIPTAELEELRRELSKVENDLQNVTQVAAEYERNMETGRKLGAKYKKLESDVANLDAFIANPTDSKCPTCDSILGKGDTSHAIEQKTELVTEMTDTMAMLQDISTKVAEKPKSSDELNNTCNDLREQVKAKQAEVDVPEAIRRNKAIASSKVDQQRAYVARFESDITDRKAKLLELTQTEYVADTSELMALDAKRVETTAKIDSISILHTAVETNLVRLETLKTGFKEVKTYVFNTLLNEINARVEYYVGRLFEIPAKVYFGNEDNKITTNIELNGIERGLGLLSGGQFRRVAIAVDLALSDIISARSGSFMNLTIMDEAFRDLSENSMSKFLDILRERTHPVILVEHNSIFKSIVDNTVKVELEHGTSTLIEG